MATKRSDTGSSAILLRFLKGSRTAKDRAVVVFRGFLKFVVVRSLVRSWSESNKTQFGRGGGGLEVAVRSRSELSTYSDFRWTSREGLEMKIADSQSTTVHASAHGQQNSA